MVRSNIHLNAKLLNITMASTESIYRLVGIIYPVFSADIEPLVQSDSDRFSVLTPIQTNHLNLTSLHLSEVSEPMSLTHSYVVDIIARIHSHDSREARM